MFGEVFLRGLLGGVVKPAHPHGASVLVDAGPGWPRPPGNMYPISVLVHIPVVRARVRLPAQPGLLRSGSGLLELGPQFGDEGPRAGGGLVGLCAAFLDGDAFQERGFALGQP